MGLRGPKPKGKVKIKWSPNFAYAIGLIVSDGNLSPDGRHIIFTSKDIELAENFIQALDIKVHIGKKASGKGEEKQYYVVQFSDVLFYQFLVKIGIMPNKSKIIDTVGVPVKYFFDFLRGTFDGDGSFYSYWDPRWKSSFMFYTVFISASKNHISWIQAEIYRRLKISGHISTPVKQTIYQLRFGKTESLKILKNMYYSGSAMFLSRKRDKIVKALHIAKTMNAQVAKRQTHHLEVVAPARAWRFKSSPEH